MRASGLASSRSRSLAAMSSSPPVTSSSSCRQPSGARRRQVADNASPSDTSADASASVSSPPTIAAPTAIVAPLRNARLVVIRSSPRHALLVMPASWAGVDVAQAVAGDGGAIGSEEYCAAAGRYQVHAEAGVEVDVVAGAQ